MIISLNLLFYGLFGAGLVLILAQIGDDTIGAFRFARLADIAPVQDQPVMGVLFVFVRRKFEQFFLHLERRFARREPGAVADAENVRIDRNRRLTERGIQNDIGGFSAEPR